MASGGKRAGAGRKKGIPNKITREIREKALKNGMLPLEYALKIMRNPKMPAERRDEMCKVAMPYVHSRLASIEHTGENGGPIRTEETLTPIEAARRIAFVIARGAKEVAANDEAKVVPIKAVK